MGLQISGKLLVPSIFAQQTLEFWPLRQNDFAKSRLWRIAESDGSTAFVPFDRTDTRPCSGCGGRDIVTDVGTGDIVCRGCGVVGAARVLLDVPWAGGRGAQSD